jgi:hypothetical protein
MRGAALPAALLCAAAGLALAFVPRKAVAPALAILCAGAVAVSLVPTTGNMAELAFLGCWATILLFAASVHVPGGVPASLAIGASGFAGLCVGAVISAEGVPFDLVRSLPLSLAVILAAKIIDRGGQIAIKIVLSWLAAVALLAALLPATGTPGYVPDHMD